MQRKKTAIIFDLDGTLIDTCADLAGSVNRMLAKNGFETHSVDAYRSFIGNGARMLVVRALGDRGEDAQLVDRCLRDFRDEYSRHWADSTQPFPGIVELLDALSARAIPFAVLTNKPHDAALDCVKKFFPRHDFAVVQGEEPGVSPKPNPVGALRVVEKMGVDPSQVLYVGDMEVDVALAKNAGFAAGAALWGYHTREMLERAGAETFFEKPADVAAFFGE